MEKSKRRVSAGEYILKARSQMGLKRKFVAKKLGVHSDTVCRWETNESVIPPAYVAPIARLLGVPPQEMYLIRRNSLKRRGR